MDDDKILAILDRLDEMVTDMDYHNWSLDSEVYGGLTYEDIIRIAKFIQSNTNTDKSYTIDYIDID